MRYEINVENYKMLKYDYSLFQKNIFIIVIIVISIV